MKKHLLVLSSLVLSAFGMSAQGTDITPANFKFPADLDIHTLIPDNIRAEAAANLVTKEGYVKNNFFSGDKTYEDGVIVLGGAFAHANDENRAKVIAGTSIYDFGGELGTALVINGQNSKLGSILGVDNLPTIDAAQGDALQIFWVLDDKALSELSPASERKTVKVSMEINAFWPDKDGKVLIYELSVKNDLGNVVSGSGDENLYANINTNKFLDENLEWDKNKWQKYELTAHTANHPLWIKMQVQAGRLNGAALLIRNVTVTYVDEAPATVGVTANEFITYEEEVPDVPEKVYPPASELDPEVFTDLTPAYFKFYNHHVVPSENLIRYDMNEDDKYGQFNMEADFISSNTDNGNKYFTADNIQDGNILLGGVYYLKANDRTPLKDGISVYNFGGEIGNAMILNGVNSKLSEAIKDKFGLENAPSLGKLIQRKGVNFVFYWILDHQSMAKAREEGKDKVRIRLEMNAYNNDMACSLPVVTSFYEQDEKSGTAFHGSNASILFNEFATKEGEWDPSHWMVYEFDIDNTEAASYLTLKISTNSDATKTHDLDNGALLIRSVEVYAYDSTSEASLRPLAVSDNGRVWNTYDLEAEDHQAKATAIRIIPSVITETTEATVTASISPSTANPAVTWSTEDTDKINLVPQEDSDNTVLISAKPNTVATVTITATSVGTPDLSASFKVKVNNNTVGVDSIDDDSVSFEVTALNGEIVVTGLAAGTAVNVYGTTGATVAKAVANGGETRIAVNSGLYIVNCGMFSVKVAVK